MVRRLPQNCIDLCIILFYVLCIWVISYAGFGHVYNAHSVELADVISFKQMHLPDRPLL